MRDLRIFELLSLLTVKISDNCLVYWILNIFFIYFLRIFYDKKEINFHVYLIFKILNFIFKI